LKNNKLNHKTIKNCDVGLVSNWNSGGYFDELSPIMWIETAKKTHYNFYGSKICPEHPSEYFKRGEINPKNIMIGGTSMDGMYAYLGGDIIPGNWLTYIAAGNMWWGRRSFNKIKELYPIRNDNNSY